MSTSKKIPIWSTLLVVTFLQIAVQNLGTTSQNPIFCNPFFKIQSKADNNLLDKVFFGKQFFEENVAVITSLTLNDWNGQPPFVHSLTPKLPRHGSGGERRRVLENYSG